MSAGSQQGTAPAAAAEEAGSVVYQPWRPSPSMARLVEQMGTVASAEGPLTVGQLYYRLVAAGALENSHRSWRRLGLVCTKARMSGLLSWDAIIDGHRPAHAGTARGGVLSEVWCDKPQLGHTLAAVIEELRLGWCPTRGLASRVQLHTAAVRFGEAAAAGNRIQVVLLVDHDVHGDTVAADLTWTLPSMAARQWVGHHPELLAHAQRRRASAQQLMAWMDDELGFTVDVERVAVTAAQADRWGLPVAPDGAGVELESMSVQQLHDVVRSSVEGSRVKGRRGAAGMRGE